MKIVELFEHSRKTVAVFAIVITLFLLILNVLYRAVMPMSDAEISQLFINNFSSYLLTVISIITVILFINITSTVNPSCLFVILSVLFLTCGLFLINHSPSILRSDPEIVFAGAIYLKGGDYTFFKKGMLDLDLAGYFFRYPHQLGLLSFESFFFNLFKSSTPKIFFYINLIMNLGSNFLLWRISNILYRDKKVENLTILLSFLFLPNLFYILFVYGTNPGIFFGLLGTWFWLKFAKNNKLLNAVLAMIFLSSAYFVRNNVIILLLSLLLISTIYFFKHKNPRLIALSIITIVFAKGASQANINHYEQLTHSQLVGEPKIAWVAMGLRDDKSSKKIPGWYDSYVEKVYKDGNGDSNTIQQLSEVELKKNLRYMLNHPGYSLTYFKNKLISTWNDGMFQSLWSGPESKHKGQIVKGKIMEGIYSQGDGFSRIYNFSHYILLLIYIGLFIGVIISNVGKGAENYQALSNVLIFYFVGGVLFHLFWETKSQYAYPYLVYVIPVAAHGLANLQNMLKKNTIRRYLIKL